MTSRIVLVYTLKVDTVKMGYPSNRCRPPLTWDPCGGPWKPFAFLFAKFAIVLILSVVLFAIISTTLTLERNLNKQEVSDTLRPNEVRTSRATLLKNAFTSGAIHTMCILGCLSESGALLLPASGLLLLQYYQFMPMVVTDFSGISYH